MKKFSLTILIALSALLLVGCATLDVLGSFERSISKTIQTTTDLDASITLDIDEQQVNLLSSSVTYALSSIPLEQSMEEKIAYARSLHTNIRLLHANNIILHEENKASFAELKNSIQVFRDLEATLAEDDKASIIADREAILASRTVVLETLGDIRILLLELQGKFNLENIDLIIENFEEIKEILTIRQTHLLLVSEKLSSVQMIVDTYLV